MGCLSVYIKDEINNSIKGKPNQPQEDLLMTVVEQLNDMINGYFEKYPHMSVNALAKKSGVPATTLRRIVQLSVKTDPAPHTALNLVSAITNCKNLNELVGKTNGPVGNLLKDSFGQFTNELVKHTYDQSLSVKLGDSVSYIIYKLAANKSGTSEWEIAQTFGRKGLLKLEELIEQGLLAKKGHEIHALEKNYSLDVSIVAGHLPELVKFYKPEEISKGQNLFYTLSESLNDQAINKIKDIQRQAVGEIFKVIDDEDSVGEIPYFVVNVCDSLTLSKSEVMQ